MTQYELCHDFLRVRQSSHILHHNAHLLPIHLQFASGYSQACIKHIDRENTKKMLFSRENTCELIGSEPSQEPHVVCCAVCVPEKEMVVVPLAC